jgi:hypothetical protein
MERAKEMEHLQPFVMHADEPAVLLGAAAPQSKTLRGVPCLRVSWAVGCAGCKRAFLRGRRLAVRQTELPKLPCVFDWVPAGLY